MHLSRLNTWFQRFGTPLIFLIVLIGLAVFGRGALRAAFIDAGPMTESAASLTDVAAAEAAAPAPTMEDAAPTAAPVAAVPDSAPIDLSLIPIRADAALAPAPDPTTFEGQRPEHDLVRYVVERGDTPGSIAERFGIKPETLLGGNPFLATESSLLQAEVELIILPIDGVLHDVLPGDTLESVAALYGVPVEDIIAYKPNNLSFPYRLYPETQIVVPGAVRDVFVWDPPDLPANTSAWWGSQADAVVQGTGTFVWPVNSRAFTQFYWYGHQAIDVGIPEGTPVYASDTGTVVYATWSTYCYGGLIVINHGNGYETFYAHLSGYNVVAGQIVTQGQLIGWSGNTGCSSGPHLHFEIRLFGNRDDPCWYLPGGCY